MKAVNIVVLTGRLTRDPEAKSTQSGKVLSSFTLAVDKGNDAVDFFDVTAWDKLAEIVNKYTNKGSKVLVQGRLNQEKWEKDGKTQTKITVTATDVTFLDSKSESTSNRKITQTEVLDHVITEEEENAPIDLSEIPF